MTKPIVVIGSANTDMIVKSASIPRPGETVLGGTFSTVPGGKGANQAVGAARAGGNVVLVARVGADVFGERAVAGFRRDGIDCSHVITDPEAPSGVALIMVDNAGENSIAVAPGANNHLSPSDISAASDIIANAGILLIQLEIPLETVRTAAAIAHNAGIPVILNPAPAQSLDSELMGRLAIITPNETEARLLTGIAVTNEPGAAQAAAILHRQGAGIVLITLGARGVYVSSPAFTGTIPGFRVAAVDTTAAGDIFNGVLAVSLVEGMDMAEAVRFSCAAAALSVTRPGAQPSAPERAEIEQFLARQRR